MKTYILLVFLVCSNISYSQKFHTICFMDSRLATYNTDWETITNMHSQIPNLLELKSSNITLKDPKKPINFQDLNDILKNINSRDILLFYYSGEYVSNDNKEYSGKFENVPLNIKYDGKNMTIKQLKEIITPKNLTMAILLFEVTTRERLENEDKFKNHHAGAITSQNAKKLFNLSEWESGGKCITMCAPIPTKQLAYKNSIVGSFFLRSFKNSLYEEMSESNPKWENIKNRTIYEVLNSTKNAQKPDGNIK